MKAYGIPMTPDHDNCFGVCIDENNKFLGSWVSSNHGWLKTDLSIHANGYDYQYIPWPISDEWKNKAETAWKRVEVK